MLCKYDEIHTHVYNAVSGLLGTTLFLWCVNLCSVHDCHLSTLTVLRNAAWDNVSTCMDEIRNAIVSLKSDQNVCSVMPQCVSSTGYPSLLCVLSDV